MSKNNVQFLSLYSMFLKFVSLMSIAGGLVNMGVFIYLWGRIKAFYDIIQTAINSFSTLAELGLSEPMPTLPDFPIWPLLLILLTTIALMIIIALTLWAISAYVDIRLDLLQREIEQHSVMNKKIDGMSHEIKIVSNYFRALSQKQQSQ